ncbi:MAG: alpha/beta fold hydrolase BchO [Pseudomonadota bacterium]
MLDELPEDWPNRAASQSITLGPIDWHVQQLGTGPDILFLHGAGSSTHSWAGVMHILQKALRCTAMDLPGHGFTAGALNFQLSLRGMTEELVKLVEALEIKPDLIVGHSAGAAIGICLSERMSNPPVVAINGAFESFEGWAGVLFPLMAKSMVAVPLVRDFFTVPLAQSANIDRLIETTGSDLDAENMGHYRKLLWRRKHIIGTLGMMSQWNLPRDLPRGPDIKTRVHFIQARNDGTVDMTATAGFRDSVPNAETTVFETGGHLIHEVQAEDIAEIIREEI